MIYITYYYTTHTYRVFVVFNKFDIGESLILSGLRVEVCGLRAKPRDSIGQPLVL